MEEEFIKNQERLKPQEEKQEVSQFFVVAIAIFKHFNFKLFVFTLLFLRTTGCSC